MEKEIALITNYYPPETGAAANRIALMARFFKDSGYAVQVICPLPNYPTGVVFNDYTNSAGITEEIDGIAVTRLAVSPTNSTRLWKRFKAMGSFSFSLWQYTRKHKLPELVFIQCSPLIVGAVGSFLARSKKHYTILNVSDLWPLAGKELGNLTDGFLYRRLEWLERYCYRKAELVLGQSQEILGHIHTLFPDKNTFLYRNFPDFEPPKLSATLPSGKIRLVYAGLLGVAQGILTLCKQLELPEQVELHLYGSGTETEAIQEYIASSGKHIVYKGSLSRKRLHQELLDYDISLVPLIKRIYGSVPSKIFEYAKLGLPMIYCGGGEGEQLIKTHQLGWVVSPGDFEALNTLISGLKQPFKDVEKVAVQKRALLAFDARKQFKQLLDHLD